MWIGYPHVKKMSLRASVTWLVLGDLPNLLYHGNPVKTLRTIR